MEEDEESNKRGKKIVYPIPNLWSWNMNQSIIFSGLRFYWIHEGDDGEEEHCKEGYEDDEDKCVFWIEEEPYYDILIFFFLNIN